MKYVIVIGDGMADHPLEELDGKTPLQAADNPNMDRIAREGLNGKLDNVPLGMSPDSDIAIMSILGHDPAEYYTGRGPLEAAGLGVELGGKDIAFRCNFVTIRNGEIKDYSAGHLSPEESEELLNAVSRKYGHVGEFYHGVDYRHLFVLRNLKGDLEIMSTPPHHALDEKVADIKMKPEDGEVVRGLNKMMMESRKFLSEHPVNERRVEEGKKPANAIWLWGQGKKPSLETIQDKYGVDGGIISAVTLVKGLGVLSGMEVFEVPGATGYYDTNYEGKADYALKALEEKDMVLIHVEAPDEAGHAGDVEKKIEAIENLDGRLIGRLMDRIEGEYCISIMPDHPTPIDFRDHVSEPVPLSVFSTRGRGGDSVKAFDEFSVEEGSLGIIEGHSFLSKLISRF
ncbi:MAG: cofactor-independent phosphoglycerate mutase [Candidatus Hadarchaeia archaeon]